jgi:hypothetical protein
MYQALYAHMKNKRKKKEALKLPYHNVKKKKQKKVFFPTNKLCSA